MTRHLQNLARLHNKMRARYGANDLLVRDLQRELEIVSSANAVAATLSGKRSVAPATGRARFQSHRGYEAAIVLSTH